MSWHNRLFLFSFPPSTPPSTSIFTVNNTVISLKLGKTFRFLLHVGWWCSLVWKEMCSDFWHQCCSYWPRLIHSEPSGQALWENIGGLLLFGWLVVGFCQEPAMGLEHWGPEMECCKDKGQQGTGRNQCMVFISLPVYGMEACMG